MSEYRKYKIKYISLVIFYGVILLIGLLLIFTHARYESQVNLNASMENAIHIINPTSSSFNIFLDGIVPRKEPYLYVFSVTNYDESNTSEVDMEYELSLITTTNLPLKYELYKNKTYNEEGAQNLIQLETVQDQDGTWYKKWYMNGTNVFYYNDKTIDTYYLYVYFDSIYKENLEYAGVIDNVQIIINARQII